MRVFGKIAILVFVLSMGGEICAHGETLPLGSEPGRVLLQGAAVCCDADCEDGCHGESCACHCLCHVPAAMTGPLNNEKLLVSEGRIADLLDSAPRHLSLPQERPPVFA